MEREKERQEQLKQLELSKLEEEADARYKARKMGQTAENQDEDKENTGDGQNQLASKEAEEGISKQFVMSVDGQEPDSQQIDDNKYGHSKSSTTNIKAEDDDKRDDVTKRREDFLNIYSEDKEKKEVEDESTDLSGGIKFKREEETEEDFKLRTSKENADGKKPLIQEIKSTDATSTASSSSKTTIQS